MPLAAVPKSSTAIRAAMTEPWPLRSEYVPDMSFMTPILMLPSLYCACAHPHPNTTASAVRLNNRFIRHSSCEGLLMFCTPAAVVAASRVTRPDNREVCRDWLLARHCP